MDHSPLWSNTLDKSLSMTGFLKDEVLNKRSQDIDTYYRLNGSIYVCNTKKLLEKKTLLLKNNIYAYKMNRKSSVDIDTDLDLLLAEIIMGRKKNEK